MRFTLSILIILGSIVVRAQEIVPAERTFRFNLQECLEYAYKNNDSLKNAQLDIQSAKYRVKETVGIGLPQVNATASFQDYIKVPKIPFPNFGFLLQDILFQQNVQTSSGTVKAPEGSPTTLFGFQQKYNANYGISINQLLFSGTYLVGLKASRTYKELSEKSFIRTKIATTVGVTKA
jgi:hypothetical protein